MALSPSSTFPVPWVAPNPVPVITIPVSLFANELGVMPSTLINGLDGLADGETEALGLCDGDIDGERDGETDGDKDEATDTVTEKPGEVSPLLLVTKTYNVPGVKAPKAAVNVIEVSPPHKISVCGDLLAKA